MISRFASWMMFGRATLLRVRDACHNLYQSKRFSGPQSDRLHSRWMRIKSFTLYSTTHPRAFGFIILFFFCLWTEKMNLSQNGGESLLAAQSQSSRWSNLSHSASTQHLFRWSRGHWIHLARPLESLRRLPASSGRAVFLGSSYSYLGSDL